MSSGVTSQPGKLPAGILAVLVHAAFIVLLVFGVSWRNQSPTPVMVDLWNNLPTPSLPAETVDEPPAKKVVPQESAPSPPPAQKPKNESPVTPKPDIALKEKEEKKKRLEAEKREEELEKKKEQERKKEDQKKQDLKKQEEARIQEEMRKEEQAARAAAQRDAQAKADKAAAAAAASSAANGMVASYMDRIRDKIKRSTQVPDNVSGHPRAEFKLVILPTGELLSVTLVKSSGNPAYDEALERGIKRAEPLPLPPDPTLFSRFRELNLPFTHEN